jgi:DNA-binding winged helix-turn-helix (wHTH) protein
MIHENNTNNKSVLVLGACRYDRATGQLTDAEGKIVRLRRQSEDVLSVLAADAGMVVDKARLIEAVWPGIATTDDSLVQCIADVRRALGRAVIETFPKRGYRLCPDAAVEPTAHVKPTGWRRSTSIACILAAIAALALMASLWRPVETAETAVSPVVLSERTLAVLPFINLSGDPERRYFSDGLSEDLATDLSKVEQLTVISHASSFDFREPAARPESANLDQAEPSMWRADSGPMQLRQRACSIHAFAAIRSSSRVRFVWPKATAGHAPPRCRLRRASGSRARE